MKKQRESIYLLGICGTGMSAVANLLKKAGHHVTGSDHILFPPASDLLEHLKIKAHTGFAQENIAASSADLFVIGNSISRGNVELEYILENNLPYTSFPELLHKYFLKNHCPVVICGTHGKTTTTSLLAHLLTELKCNPSFFIGGAPFNFPYSSHLGEKNSFFLLEGDEYDTVFYDKRSKFLHYCPQFLIINNLEFDHADIFESLDDIDQTFAKLIELVKDKSQIVANVADPGVARLINKHNLFDKVYKIGLPSTSASHEVEMTSMKSSSQSSQLTLMTKQWGEITIETNLIGNHNLANLTQAIAFLALLEEKKHIPALSEDKINEIIQSFKGVAKRLEFIGHSKKGAHCYLDFAHHPTSVAHAIRSMKNKNSEKRIIALYEPKNATSRRNIFTKEYAESLSLADYVIIAPCLRDQRIPEEEQMNTNELAKSIGQNSFAAKNPEEIESWIEANNTGEDILLFMSCGNFSGIPQKIAHKNASHTSFN